MNPQQPKTPQQPQQGGFQPQPVAYDKDGNPLYAQPQFVHMARAIDPVEQEVPPQILALHEASQKKYRHLNLSRGEYILSAVKRHPIGMLKIWVIGLVLIAALMAMYVVGFTGGSTSDVASVSDYSDVAAAVLGVMIILVIAGTLVASYVYDANRFYLTNESVIQEIQTSLFSKHEQTVSLSNIEDASYKQGGVFPMIFNYGTIRLSTEGDETTYRFSYVSSPKRQIAILNNAVEAFKNGRPVDPPTDDQPS